MFIIGLLALTDVVLLARVERVERKAQRITEMLAELDERLRARGETLEEILTQMPEGSRLSIPDRPPAQRRRSGVPV